MTNPAEQAQYATALAHYRQGKDHFFESDPNSPIRAEERSAFAGLRYFPADLTYRVTAKVERLPDNNTIVLATTDGAARPFTRYAHLVFAIAGRELHLTAFRALDTPGASDEPVVLFVPFRDTLAGNETYGAGRYLDVEEEPAGAEDGTIVLLDFNMAYNPYCAYNANYSCPLTPPENVLPLPIPVGERI